jgi:endoglucanase
LGINVSDDAYVGPAYQKPIINYVQKLNAKGLYVILELHFSAPGTRVSDDQLWAPDQDHSPTFWSSVAGTFKDYPAVLFNLFNEPSWRFGGETAR